MQKHFRPQSAARQTKMLLPPAHFRYSVQRCGCRNIRQGEVVFRQYLEDREAARRAVEQQFEPRRKAREEELSRRYNQRISLSLAQDPEYVSTLSKHLNALRAQYEAVVAEIRGRIQEAGGLQEEEDGGQAEG